MEFREQIILASPTQMAPEDHRHGCFIKAANMTGWQRDSGEEERAEQVSKEVKVNSGATTPETPWLA